MLTYCHRNFLSHQIVENRVSIRFIVIRPQLYAQCRGGRYIFLVVITLFLGSTNHFMCIFHQSSHNTLWLVINFMSCNKSSEKCYFPTLFDCYMLTPSLVCPLYYLRCIKNELTQY